MNHTTNNSQIRCDEGLTLETLASESLYGGQFALSTQIIKPNYLVIPPPSQHHSFFRNLPACFIRKRTVVIFLLSLCYWWVIMSGFSYCKHNDIALFLPVSLNRQWDARNELKPQETIKDNIGEFKGELFWQLEATALFLHDLLHS